MLQYTGPGTYRVSINRPDEFEIALENFDIDGTRVKPIHRHMLRRWVGPLLKRGGTASILGLASLTASRRHDLLLSERRAQEVLAFLRGLSSPSGGPRSGGPARFPQVDGVGKLIAQSLSVSTDPLENARFRAVWVHAWDRPVPPSRLPRIHGMKLSTLPTSNPLLTGAKVLDVATWLLTAARYAELLGELIPVASLAMSIIDTLSKLIVTWMKADQAAYLNGYILGYDLAMGDMAAPYADPALGTRPLSSWPAVVRPSPHTATWSNQPNVSQEKWHEGETAGCQAAYQQVLTWDRQPLRADVGGHTIQLHGREVLRTLALRFRDEVPQFFVLYFNHALQAKGRHPFPTLP